MWVLWRWKSSRHLYSQLLLRRIWSLWPRRASWSSDNSSRRPSQCKEASPSSLKSLAQQLYLINKCLLSLLSHKPSTTSLLSYKIDGKLDWEAFPSNSMLQDTSKSKELTKQTAELLTAEKLRPHNRRWRFQTSSRRSKSGTSLRRSTGLTIRIIDITIFRISSIH